MQPPKQLKESPFIDQLKNNHYVICPKDILFGFPNVTMQEKFAYLYLIQYGLFSIMNGHVDKAGNPIIYASQERLAKDMNVSQPTVSRYCKKLEEEGLISIHSQGKGASNYTTVYPTTYAQVNTKPIHPRIQYIRDKETVENKNTDATASEVNESNSFSLKASKKDKAREERKTTTRKAVTDVIGEILSKPPKARTEKPKPSDKPIHDRRNSKTLFEHYSGTYEKHFEGKPPLSTGKDLKLLKDLITHYGYDTVVGMIDFTLENFSSFKRDKSIMGQPTIGVIYGFRAYLEEKSKLMQETPPTNDHGQSGNEESAW